MAQVPEIDVVRAFVLDANIVLRGTRVRTLIERYVNDVSLLTPQSALMKCTNSLAARVSGLARSAKTIGVKAFKSLFSRPSPVAQAVRSRPSANVVPRQPTAQR